jgi:hypothetical protein
MLPLLNGIGVNRVPFVEVDENLLSGPFDYKRTDLPAHSDDLDDFGYRKILDISSEG